MRRLGFGRVAGVCAVTVAAVSLGMIGPSPNAVARADSSDLNSLVNVFIGTQDNAAYNTTESAYGDTSPGATTPFGMVNFNPNTYNSAGGSNTNQGGYEYNADELRGFSLHRISGTGCA